MENQDNNDPFPLVTLFVPSYNHAEYIQETLLSIINQSYKNIELLIVDDGSIDNSAEVIQNFKAICDERFVRYEFQSAKHQGLTSSLNHALKWSNGKYFAMLASDDVYYPFKIEDQVPKLEADECLMGVFGGCDLIDSNSVIVDEILPNEEIFTFNSIIKREHSIITPTQLLRTEAVLGVGGYPPELYIEDWYMWLALTKYKGTIKVLKEKYVKYRLHEKNMSKNIPKMHKGRMDILSNFKDSNFYQFSRGKVFLGSSIEYSWIDKRQSLLYLIQAIKSSTKIFITSEFYRALFRLFFPSFLVNIAKKYI
jgi:alpha-1,3-rhamnosyltransferase